MALIQCKECGNKISDKAKTCPQCGAPVPKKSCAAGCLKFIGIIVVILFGTIVSLGTLVGITSAIFPKAASQSKAVVVSVPTTEKKSEPPKEATPSTPIAIPPTVEPKPEIAPPNAAPPAAEAKEAPKPKPQVSLVQKGEELFKKLKAEYPDPPDDGKYSLPPRIVEMSIYGEMTSYPVMQLNVPDEAWLKLSEEDKTALVEYTKSQVIEARSNPDKYQMTPPSAPAYQTIRRNVQGIKDDAWKICIGHIDKKDGLVVDATVLWGASANAGQRIRPVASVTNSAWDGSVYQVERWLKSNLKDPDSLQFIEWSPVQPAKDGGYLVRSKYRAKNSFGGYIVENKLFYLDSQGNVTESADIPK